VNVSISPDAPGGQTSSQTTYPVPPFDRELAPLLASGQLPATVDIERMVGMRTVTSASAVDDVLAARGLVREDRRVPGLEAEPDLIVRRCRGAARLGGRIPRFRRNRAGCRDLPRGSRQSGRVPPSGPDGARVGDATPVVTCVGEATQVVT